MELKALLDKYIVFIDTSTWLYPEANDWITEQLPQALKESEKRVRISGKVVEEVTKHIKNGDEALSKQAKQTAQLLNQYHKDEIIEVYQDPDDPFQDQAILAMFMKYRTKFPLAMVTQDRNFALDVENLNKQGSVQSTNTILVFYIDIFGKLMRWDYGVKEHEKRMQSSHSSHQGQAGDRNERSDRNDKSERSEKSSKPKEKIVALPLGTKVETGLDTELPVSHFPSEGESVRTDAFGELQLMKELGKGGEGGVFLTSNGMVCKIYTKMTKARYEKLKLMLDIPFNKEGICWPQSLAYNSKGECIGYMMSAASGKVMQLSMFHKKLLEKNFPHWNRGHLVELALTILDKIKYLHDRNIIIGDINPFNIMIKDYNEVYFVDTDSYQIVNYPCPVGTINFTPPEAQGMRYHEYLRTFEHEQFAVATLVFMTLMPGKPPYAQQGGGTPGENIKNMEFPYPFGDSKGNAPDGVWRYIWSHFTYKLKEKFYQAFAENKRFSTDDWIQMLESYLYAIKRGHSNDEIWPMSNKVSEENAVEVTCNQCSSQFVMHEEKKNDLDAQGKFYICNACLMKNKLTRVQRDEAAATSSAATGKSQATTRRTSSFGTNTAAKTTTRSATSAALQARARANSRSSTASSSSARMGASGNAAHTSSSTPVVVFTPKPPGLLMQGIKFIASKIKK